MSLFLLFYLRLQRHKEMQRLQQTNLGVNTHFLQRHIDKTATEESRLYHAVCRQEVSYRCYLLRQCLRKRKEKGKNERVSKKFRPCCSCPLSATVTMQKLHQRLCIHSVVCHSLVTKTGWNFIHHMPKTFIPTCATYSP